MIWEINVKRTIVEVVNCLVEADDEAMALVKFDAGRYRHEHDEILRETVVAREILGLDLYDGVLDEEDDPEWE
jgi:hypothetical protein